ncbi:polysaccharide lyase [Podospora fimiseda]|uniref:Polysaccharide lyase n=1 Tax=Podospora fimiseda TaxID=252190 RepID=A0AAN7BH55_9PEZI|nr:polysaccharide lyase [Podospora fimiseda]
MHSLLSSLIPLLLLFSPSHQTQIFTNRGTLSGWSARQTEHLGTLTESTTEFFDSPPSLVASQTFDASYTGRYHSEVRLLNAYTHSSSSKFYGFAFKLPSDWQFSPAQSYDISQFIAPFDKCDSFMPTTMVWLDGTKLNTRLKSGSVCAQQTKRIDIPSVTVTAGRWHKIVMEVKWKPDATGLYRMWYDDKLVVDQKNVATTVAEDVPFQWRVGLYANGWHDDKGMRGTQGTRRVFYDKMAVATTKDEADPDKW